MNPHIIDMLELVSSRPMPTEDLDKRDSLEREWLDSLTVADALALLSWVEKPWFPSGSRTSEWTNSLRTEASRIAGAVGKRGPKDPVLDRLATMLAIPELRRYALAGLDALEDARSAEVLRRYRSEPDHEVIYLVTAILAKVANPAAIALLEEMLAQQSADRFIRSSIIDSLNEAKAAARSAQSR
jgi:hypothetical protein